MTGEASTAILLRSRSFRALFQKVLTAIAALRPLPPDVNDRRRTGPMIAIRHPTTASLGDLPGGTVHQRSIEATETACLRLTQTERSL
jgi:hypothetical protein